jgi:hypothetical protein
MLNLNLNIIGAGVGKNKSTYDPRLFIAMLENFYTASLLANARFDVVVSGSTIFNEPRNFKTSITSSADASTQEEFVVVGQTTYLIERTSAVTASFYGFPKWDPVQFGDPSIFNNVTMSLEIPGVGYSSSSYGTGSFLEHKFIAEPKATYFINATITFDPYYDSTIIQQFDQSSSFQTELDITGSETGYLIEQSLIGSGSDISKISTKPSSSVDLTVKGVGDWGIIHAVPLDANFSQSLVTMSLETPLGFSYSYNTASLLTASFEPPLYIVESQIDTTITSSVNTKNPFIPIEYMVVGGGQWGINNSTNDWGGGGGFVNWGIINIDKNSNSITASAGGYGPSSGDGGSPDGWPSYMYWGNNTASAAGGNFRTRVGICGTTLNAPTQWVDGQIYGANGVGGEISPVSQSQCNKPSSSYVPNSSGVGGDGSWAEFPIRYPQSGLVAIRYYDPNNFYSSSISGSVVTNVSGGYHYHYFTGNDGAVSNVSKIEFHFEEQEHIVDIPTVPTASGFTIDYLLVGGGASGGSGAGGGGGGAGQLLSGSTTIPANGYFNTTISIGDGGGVPPREWQGYPGFKSTFNGTLQAFARGGGGGRGNNQFATYDGYGGSSNPGGGSGGGGAGRQDGGTGIPDNWINGNPGGVGQWYGNNVAFGGGGGGALTSGSGGEAQGGYGGSGSMWLDGNIYAGGGGAGRTMDEPTASFLYTGGPGGGGNGSLALNVNPYPATLATSGSANTGGGGGGSALGNADTNPAGAGGSGVAIFRLPTSDYNFLTASNHITTGSNIDTYTSSSYTFIRARNDSNLTIFNSIN